MCKVFKTNSLLIEIAIIKFLHFIFGQYYEISSSKVFSVIHRIYCILITILITWFLSNTITNIDQSSIVKLILCIILSQNLTWSLASQLTNQAYLSSYLLRLRTYDVIMGYKKHIFESKSTIIIMLISFVGKIYYFIDYLNASIPFKFSVLFNIFKIHICFVAAEIHKYKLMLALGLLQTRLKLLRKTLEQNTIPVNIVGQNMIIQKLQNARKCLLNYNSLLSTFDDIDAHAQYTVSTLQCQYQFTVYRYIYYNCSFFFKKRNKTDF